MMNNNYYSLISKLRQLVAHEVNISRLWIIKGLVKSSKIVGDLPVLESLNVSYYFKKSVTLL